MGVGGVYVAVSGMAAVDVVAVDEWGLQMQKSLADVSTARIGWLCSASRPMATKTQLPQPGPAYCFTGTAHPARLQALRATPQHALTSPTTRSNRALFSSDITAELDMRPVCVCGVVSDLRVPGAPHCLETTTMSNGQRSSPLPVQAVRAASVR